METDPIYRDRMIRLADTIESADRFDYSCWYGIINDPEAAELDEGPVALNLRCDTVGCIGGWAVAQAITEGIIDADDFVIGVAGTTTSADERLVIEIEASRYLGLTSAEADSLFIGHAMAGAGWYEDNTDALAEATAIEAGKMLRGVASGEYDLRELRERSFQHTCICDDCVAERGE